MPTPFLLDTNAYFLLFQNPKPQSYFRLLQKIKVGTVSAFYISEITSMEIHSVLGKYRRGSSSQPQPCNREILDATGVAVCSNRWIPSRRKKMRAKVFRDIRKMILDIEAQKGDIQATIMKLETSGLVKGRELLIKYADRYSLDSHDALIGGSVGAAREIKGINLTLVTSDKGLQAVLRDESIPFFDPNI